MKLSFCRDDLNTALSQIEKAFKELEKEIAELKFA